MKHYRECVLAERCGTPASEYNHVWQSDGQDRALPENAAVLTRFAVEPVL